MLERPDAPFQRSALSWLAETMALILSASFRRYFPGQNPLSILSLLSSGHITSVLPILVGAGQSLRSTMGCMIGTQLAIDWGTG